MSDNSQRYISPHVLDLSICERASTEEEQQEEQGILCPERKRARTAVLRYPRTMDEKSTKQVSKLLGWVSKLGIFC